MDTKIFTTKIAERKNSDPQSRVSPDYDLLVSGFSGSMIEWDDLVLKTHNAFGYGFNYDQLADKLLDKIIDVFPDSEKTANSENALEDIVTELSNKYDHQFIEMLSVVDKQTERYWSGELEEKELIDYGFV